MHGSLLYMHIYVTTAGRSMYVYSIHIYTVIIYSKGKDQPGKVANPALGQLAEQGK